jgi:hypothetical protein
MHKRMLLSMQQVWSQVTTATTRLRFWQWIVAPFLAVVVELFCVLLILIVAISVQGLGGEWVVKGGGAGDDREWRGVTKIINPQFFHLSSIKSTGALFMESDHSTYISIGLLLITD